MAATITSPATLHRSTECLARDFNLLGAALPEEVQSSAPGVHTYVDDFRKILDVVAGNDPIDNVLDGLVQIVQQQIPGSVCTIDLRRARQRNRGRKLPPAATSFRRSQSDSTEQLLALANSVNAIQAGTTRQWSFPGASKSSKIIGYLTLQLAKAGPLSGAQTNVIETAMKLAALAVERRRLHASLAQQSATDRATGLPDRYAFEHKLEKYVRSSKSAAVIWIGFDRFQDIDESVGYRTTDALLRAVARRISAVLKKGEWLARVGVSEFAVVSRNSSVEQVSIRAERILEELESVFFVQRYKFYLDTRIGIAVYPDHALTAPALQQSAVDAFYGSVRTNGFNYSFYQYSAATELRERLRTVRDLRLAFGKNELQLFYQPQVDMNQRLVGMEALIRWNHPTRGILAPGQFIDVAEETGLIVPMGEWVIREACRQCAEWNRSLRVPLKVAVNVSALQLYFSDLTEIVASSLAETGLAPNCFEIELTESAVMRNVDESARTLQKLRDLGVTIAIDDFGTGYSSLSYLQKLPVDLLKIDRSFLQHIQADTTTAVVQAITALGHSLGLRVVAEGVETKEQMDQIRGIGVDLAQGYLIARPMPSDCVVDWMRPERLML
jgi:diguanylate cyclase (GGDEF)-like protein